MNAPDQVLAYQQAGWSIVPAAIEGKRALVSWKQWQTVAASPEQLAEWAHRRPRCCWAVITGPVSGVVVVDIDPRHRGNHALAELEQRHGDLPWSAVVETPSGGWHVYLRHPGGRIPNSASRIGLGIDVRGDNGLALLPPSRRPDGQYRWAIGGPATVPPMPDTWAELLRPTPKLATCSKGTAPGADFPPVTSRRAGRDPQRPPARPRRATELDVVLVRQTTGRDGRPGRTRPLAPDPGRHRPPMRTRPGRDPGHPRLRPGSRPVTTARESPGQPPGTGYRWLPIDDRILDILAAHHGPAGICPKIPRIGQLLGISPRYVRQRLAALEDAAIVQRIHVFERDDDPEWQSRGHRSTHPGRQTSSSYRLLQFRGPPGTPTNLVGKADAQVNPPELAVTDSPVSSALEGKEPAGGGYKGDREEGEREPAPHEPIEIAVEPPEQALLDHDPDVSEILATLGQTFGDVRVLEGPATYRTARGRVIDLATASTSDLHKALEQLDKHTCRRWRDDSERCTPDQPCERHTARRRAR
jgi:hypothetical protein